MCQCPIDLIDRKKVLRNGENVKKHEPQLKTKDDLYQI